MDEICESQDYYRKHVANDGESLYRSISDSVFGSQNYKFIVAKAVELIMNEASSDEKNILSEFAPNYPLVCRLAKRFHFCVEIISAADDTMTPFTFSPKQKNSRFVFKLKHGFIKNGVIFSVFRFRHCSLFSRFLNLNQTNNFFPYFLETFLNVFD